MSDERKRIVNLPAAEELNATMQFVEDTSDGTGTRRVPYNLLEQSISQDGGSRTLAPAYDATATYAVGDYVMYQGTLYKCSTAIATAEAWTAAHWTAAPLAPTVADISDRVDVNSDEIIAITEPAGKNLFDADQAFGQTDIACNDGVYSATVTKFVQWFGSSAGGFPVKNGFKANTRYTISMDIRNTGNVSTESGWGIRIYMLLSDNTTKNTSVSRATTEFTRISLISNAETTISKIYIAAVESPGNVWEIKNIQIEEKSYATSYAPYVPNAVDIVARQSAEDANTGLSLLNGKLYFSPLRPNAGAFFIRYSDGAVQSSESSKCFVLLADGIRKIKFKSTELSSSIAAIAFYSSYTPSESTYIKASSLPIIQGGAAWYEADVPDTAKIICLSTLTTDPGDDTILIPIYNADIFRTMDFEKDLYGLSKNPYAGIAWSVVVDLTSTTHAHCINQVNFNVLKTHYDHVAISNYHPAVPAYPLDNFFEDVGDLLGSPNTEMSAFTYAEFPATHMNPVGSVLVGGEGFHGTEKDFVKESIMTRQYPFAGGVTINHPVYSGLDLAQMKRLIAIPGVIAMEIYNASSAMSNVGFAIDLWDQILSEGIQIYGVAVPDHNAQSEDETEYGYGYNHLLVTARTELECLNAYRMGHFYATLFDDGLELKNYALSSAMVLSIEVSEASTYKFVTAKRTVEVSTASTTATFDANDDDVYVRCEVTRGRNTLYTNAIMI